MSRARELARLGNANAISVDTSNNVGLGTTSSIQYKLDVVGDANFTGVITATAIHNADGVVGGGATDNINTNNIKVSGISTLGTASATTLTATTSTVVGSAVTFNASGGTVVGVLTATSFSGSGANLTGIAVTEYIDSASLTVSGIATFNGVGNFDAEVTAAGGVDVTGGVKSAGIVTFTNTTASTSSATGALVVSGGVGIAGSLHVGENVSIGGTLTYEDVTNIDSVGIVTAQLGVIATAGRGVQITAGGLNVTAGIATFKNEVDADGGVDIAGGLKVGAASTLQAVTVSSLTSTGTVTIPDDIVHSGDTNTKIRFPDADTITAETAGSERVRVTSAGKVGINSVIAGHTLDVFGNIRSHKTTPSLYLQTTGTAAESAVIRFGDAASFQNGSIQYDFSSNQHLRFKMGGAGNNVERMTLVGSTGYLGIGTAAPSQTLQLLASSGDVYTRVDTNVNGGMLIYVQGTQRSIFANDSAFSGTITDTGIGAKGNMIFRAGTSSYDERLRITSAGKIQVTGTRGGALQPEDDDTLQLYTAASDNSINRGSGITFYNHDNSGYEQGGTIQVAKENGTADNEAAYMRFNVRPAGATNVERLRITSTGAFSLNNGELVERCYIQSSPAWSSNGAVNLDNGVVQYNTSNYGSGGAGSLYFTSSVGINTQMSTGDIMSLTMMTNVNSTAGYINNIFIDGQAATETWVGGSAPTAGGGSGVDIYTFNIIKTASATYTVIANQVKTS